MIEYERWREKELERCDPTAERHAPTIRPGGLPMLQDMSIAMSERAH